MKSVEQINRNRSLINSFLLFFVLFFYIYQCAWSFLGIPSNITSQRIIIVILSFVVIEKSIKHRNNNSIFSSYAGSSFRHFVLLHVVILLYSVFLYLIIGPGDGVHILTIVINIFLLDFLGAFLFSHIIATFDELMKLILAISIAQAIIIWACLLMPDFSASIDSWFGQEEYFTEARRGYAGGISCITSQGAIKMSLGLMSNLYFLTKSNKGRALLIILYFILGITTALVARTGLVFFIVGLFTFLSFISVREKSGTIIKIILVVAIIIAVFFWIMTVAFPEFFETNFSRMLFLFNVGINDAFLDNYKNSEITYVPSLQEGFWGVGITSGISGNGIRVNVDGGLRRLYSGFGLPMAVIFYLTFIIIMLKTIFKLKVANHKYFFLLFAIYLSIAEFKEPTLYNTYMLGVYFLSSLLAFHDERTH